MKLQQIRTDTVSFFFEVRRLIGLILQKKYHKDQQLSQEDFILKTVSSACFFSFKKNEVFFLYS